MLAVKIQMWVDLGSNRMVIKGYRIGVKFVRSVERNGRVPVRTKILQGVGIVPGSLLEFAFSTFLLLFYNQVLGLSASQASLALLVALIVDAVSDPVVGSFSDNIRHRLGRRHLLMYLAILPFSGSLYCLFNPPPLDQGELFFWLMLFAVATRLSFTLFSVPWNALFAELSDDYKERSELVAYRFAVGWVVGVIFTFTIYAQVFTASEEYPQGQLNPDHYPLFALLLMCTVFVGAFITTHFTRDQIQYLRQPASKHRRFSAKVLFEEIGLALQNADFRILFLVVLASAVVTGTNQALQIYMNTYFWGFGGEALKWMSFAVVGGFVAFLTAVPLQGLLDKKYVLVLSNIGTIVATAIPVTMRLLGIAPPNGSSELIVLVVCSTILISYFITVSIIMFASMVADTIDVQELRTGLRQEGLFNSVMTFSSKATTGAGILIAGLLLDFVVGLPQGATASAITPQMIFKIGVLEAYIVPIFNVVSLILILRYTLTREQHAKVQRQLKLNNL
ncbi:MAG: hypothetical protein GXP16_18930 [Gammaproteobacteria bacterium]|nr:hypothetical protein [Gammaproteobacteria bacterium]